MTATLEPAALSHFIGTIHYYRHPLVRHILMTDGVHYLMNHGAAWLVDEIALRTCTRADMQAWAAWHLAVPTTGRGVLTVSDGNDTQFDGPRIIRTDFPPPGVTIYMIDGVMMLSSEY